MEYDHDGSIKDIYHGFASDGKEIEIALKHEKNQIISIYPSLDTNFKNL
ncbi:hypothetical protein [Flavobacterium ginsenosidimutans]|nr:hypothetical protein [Flavobacterium ginsenosidimutans]KAF2330532.1 hypothetical protein DM444_14405 [Flavobacterium ginsenosidimutans]